MTKKIEFKQTGLDKAISRLFPVWGAKRAKARYAEALVGAYAGASRTRRPLSKWNVSSGDADTDILSDLPLLRERSRDMMRNAPLACGAVNTALTNVVGSGLKLQARIDRSVLGMTDEQADAWEDEVEREWKLFSESQECDSSRTLNFAEMQGLVFLQTLENGDIFVNLPRFTRPGSPYYLKLQLIEADRVCNKDHAADSPTLSGGVEKDSCGAPTAYHILEQHPGNIYATKRYTWQVVNAFNSRGERNVLHPFRMLRPGQSRGVPYLAPVIESLKQLDRYTESELAAAVISSFLTIVLSPQASEQTFPEINNNGYGTETKSSAGGSSTQLTLGSGMIIELDDPKSINTINPNRPNAQFDPFVKAILEQIGVALELPYEVLVHHFTASYSASRAALLEAWRFFRGRRTWLVSNFCQPVYEAWLTEAVALGRINAPGFFADPRVKKAYCSSVWVGEALTQLDPKKEAEAAKIMVEAGFSTVDEQTVILTGGDFQDNLPRITKERKQLAEIGLWQPVQAQTAKPSEPEPQEETDEE